VREHFADEAPRVVMVADRRPSMSLYPSPWLDKPAALLTLWRLVSATAVGELGLVGYLDAATWRAPASGAVLARLEPEVADARFDAPESALDDAFAHLGDVRRSLPPGTFVFVCSDFLAPPEPAWWARALAYRWDVVPVILQDPVWEQSFPDVDGVVVPFTEPGGRKHGVRLRRGESAGRRSANEARLTGLVGEMRAFGLEPVLLDRSDDAAVFDALSAWGETRLAVRRGEW
jgi:hypothetical protein